MEVEALNTFGTQLLKRWREQHPEENVVFSTLGLAGAFALLFPGACGVTRTELDAVFGFESKNLTQFLGSEGISRFAGKPVVKWANRLYVDQRIAVEEEYLRNVGAGLVERADFSQERAALDAINAWVSKKTRRFIPEVLEQLDKDTLLVAVNALYFKGRWEHQFPPGRTYDDSFRGVHGSETVPFMQLSGACLGFLRCPDQDGVLFELPYENSLLSMIIFLPNSPDGWQHAEEVMPAYWNELLKGKTFIREKVDSLRVPKWELEFKFDKLPQMLMDLGLRSAFSSDDCDFGNITKDPRRVYVSDVVHKCKIIVNEEGTEAAAASSVQIGRLADTSTLNIRVDHPFLYFIVDKKSRAILFQGTQTSISSKSRRRMVEYLGLRQFARRCSSCLKARSGKP